MSVVPLPPINGSKRQGPLATMSDDIITDPLVRKGLESMNASDAMWFPASDDAEEQQPRQSSNNHSNHNKQHSTNGGHTTSSSSNNNNNNNNTDSDSDSGPGDPVSNLTAGHQSYKQRLDRYMSPLVRSMMSERPPQPHSFIVDYIKQTCTGKKSKRQMQRPFERRSFLEYKAHVLDPTIMPLMADLFVKQPARPLQAIFQHAKTKLNVAEEQYAGDLVEIELFDETARAMETQQFDALHQAIERARAGGILAGNNVVLMRAEKARERGEQLKKRSRRRAQATLAAELRKAQKMMHALSKIDEPAKKVKRLSYLKMELGTAVARAHRQDVPDDDVQMKLALGEIIIIAREFRRQQLIVQDEHRARALRSLDAAIQGLDQNPAALGILEFSLHRARALQCSADAPEVVRATEILATWEQLQRTGSGSSFSLGLVGKIKTQMGQQLKQARINIEEVKAAQQAFDQQLEDSDDEFYRDLGFSDDENDLDSSDDDEAHDAQADGATTAGSKPTVV